MPKFVSVPLPSDLLAARLGMRKDYGDCYQIDLGRGAALPEPDLLARLFLAHALPSWMRALFSLRQRLGGRKKEGSRVDLDHQGRLVAGERVGPWRIALRNEDEIVFDEDAPHLRFAFSLRCLPGEGRIQASTLVEFHNGFGRLYFLPVKPIHRRLVPAHLEKVWARARNHLQESKRGGADPSNSGQDGYPGGKAGGRQG